MSKPPNAQLPSFSRIFRDRKVKKRKVKKFLETFLHPEKPKRALTREKWKRSMMAVSRSVSGTLREFERGHLPKRYIRNSKRFVREIMAKKPSRFVLVGPQFLGRRGKNLVERVYPAPNIHNLLTSPQNGYFYPALVRRLRRKGIDLSIEKVRLAFNEDLRDAHYELIDLSELIGRQNILVLDYDPIQKKFLFMLVDHEHPSSRVVR